MLGWRPRGGVGGMPNRAAPAFTLDSPTPPLPMVPPSGAGKLTDRITAGNMPKRPTPLGTGVPLARLPKVVNRGDVRPRGWTSTALLAVEGGDPSVNAGLAR